MLITFRNALSKARGAILGWGLGLFALSTLFMPVYESMAEDAEQLDQLLSLYPEEMMAFFGEFTSFASPEGFLTIEYFSFMPVVLGIYALLAGGGMLAGDEESGTLDLIASYPVSRSSLFWGRALSVVVSLALILVIAYAGILIPAEMLDIEIAPGDLLNPFLSLYAQLLVLAGFALVLSMLLPSRRLAAMLTGILVVADFFIQGLAKIYDGLEPVAKILPQHYYQSSDWTGGLQLDWFAGLVGAALVFTLLAWWQFLRRDIRVAGEGGWQMFGLSRLLRRGRSQAGGD